MKYAYTYLAMCLLPIFVNYEPEERTESPTELSEPKILFWCECGVKEHWKTRPLKKLN